MTEILKGKVMKMLYDVEDIIELGYPHIIRMSFELPYFEWCRFEKSKLCQDLISYLSELQKQGIPISQQVEKD